MLVLSRQKDESIMIGDEVEITIVDVRGDKVRLGITAPKNIPVHRREIYDAIQREKAQKDSALHLGDNEPADKPEDAAHKK
jgi:carbon storage regulator